ncbi:MAG: response regulator [Roseivirga sp.]|nr:response regulator [Roseivirga sp.]
MKRTAILLELSNWLSGKDPAKSRGYAKQVLEEGATATDEDRTWAYRLSGESYYDENKNDSALSEFQRARKYSRLLEMTDETLGIATRISDTQRNLGNIEAAFEVAFEALSLADSVGNHARIGSLHSRIGELYREQNETDKAILHLKNAYEAYSIAKRERGMLASRVNLALAYKQKDAEKALETYEGVLTEFSHLFTPWDSARIYSNLANINLDLERYPETEAYLMQALECHTRIDKPISLAYCYKELGELYIRTDRPERVVQYASQALQMANRFEHTSLQYQSSKQLSDAYARLGNFAKAYRYLEDFMRFQDEVRNTEKIELSSELEARYATAQKEQKIQLQEEQLARQEAEMNKELFLRNALIGGVVLLLVLGVFIYRNAQLQVRKKNEIKQFADKVQELQSTQSRWFTNIAHELRTPLTLILGPIQNLRKRPEMPPTLRSEVDLAKKYGDQLINQVNEILEISRLESGKLVLNQRPIDLIALLKQVVASFESYASEKGVMLSLQYGSSPVTMNLDSNKVITIINNLVSNAIKFTPANNSVSIELKEPTKEDDTVRVAVKDSGVGISAKNLPYVFDRFYQASQAKDQHYGGSGVGLTLSQELAKLHQGLISVISEIGQGSLFTLSLPSILITHEVPESIIERESADEVDTGVILSSSENSRPKILLVEDHPDMRSYIRQLLNSYYDVTEASNGIHALNKLEQLSPDLIISDVRMPEMDGLDFARKVKAKEKYRFIPFINLTAHANEKDRLLALKTGVDDYLVKPFDAEELLARVNNLINNAQERRQAIAELTEEQPEKGDLSHDEKVMAGLERLVWENMAESSFSVAELGQMAAMSTSSLNRHVKKMTGLTPGQLIRDIRLQRAIELLESNQLGSISEVVYEVGFEDVSSFSRLFKKRFGRSPSSYK